MKTKLIASFCISCICLQLISQPGTLDPSFGDDGTIMSPVTSFVEHGYALAVQPDGKILVAGYQEVSGDQDFAVARFLADGTLDDSFGLNGLATIDAGTNVDAAWSMILQADGKILLGGSVFMQQTTSDDYAVVRLNADGTPDDTFGTNGIVITDIDGLYDNAYQILVQPDGKILLGGDGYINNKRNACIVRYNPDGSLDEAFGILGMAYLSVGIVEDKTKDIALQSDGKILAVGAFNDGMDDQAFVARFNSDGTVDTFFGSNGMATIDIGGREDRLYSVCVTDDDKIIVGGYTRDESAQDNDYLFMKYTVNGELDLSFGSNGIKMFHFGVNDQALDMTLQDDGRIVSIGGAFSFELLRLQVNGDLDNDFGDNGKVNTTVGTYCFGNRISLYGDNRVVVAGQAEDGGLKHFALARYHLEDEGGIKDEPKAVRNLIIYPNPQYGNKFNVEYLLENNSQVSIDLLSINGQQLDVLLDKERRLTGKNTENLKLPENLSPGIYLIRVLTPESSSIIKLELL